MKRNVGSINLWDLSQLLTLQPLLLKRQIQAYTKEHLRLNIFSCISRSMKAICNSRCHFKCHLPQLPWARRRVQIVLIFHQWKTVWEVMFINTFLCWLSAAHARSEQGVKALGEGRGSDGWMKPFSSFESLPQWGHSSWEMERNLMMPICVGCPCPEDAQVQRMTESHFSRLRLICVSITLWEAENASHTGLSQACKWTTLCSQWCSP